MNVKSEPTHSTNKFFQLALKAIGKRKGTYISGEYQNAKSSLSVRCENNHVFSTTWDRLKQSKWCGQCPRSTRLRYTIADMRKIARDKGGTCISDAYGGLKKKLRWKCDKHEDFEATPSDLIYGGTWCPECGKAKKGRAPMPLATAQAYVTAKNGTIIDSNRYNGGKSKITVRCADQHIWEVSVSSLVHQKSWCPHCRTLQGETICRAIFEETFGVVFPKVRPNFLKGKELDGFAENLKLAFEYQGPYHNDPAQQKRDAQKRELCAIHNIQLAAIDYIPKPSIAELLPRIRLILSQMGITRTVVPPREGIVLFPSKWEELKRLAKDKGGSLISKEYLGEDTKHEWKCSVKTHPSWTAVPYNIRKDIWCRKCSGYDKKDLTQLADRGARFNLRLLSTKYKRADSSYRWQCALRMHEFLAPIGNIDQRARAGRNVCTKCAGTSRITVEEIDRLISPQCWRRISTVYESPRAPMTFHCSNGHEFVRSWNKIQQGYGCQKNGCADNRRHKPIDRSGAALPSPIQA